MRHRRRLFRQEGITLTSSTFNLVSSARACSAKGLKGMHARVCDFGPSSLSSVLLAIDFGRSTYTDTLGRLRSSLHPYDTSDTMAPIQIIDKYNLVISLLITMAWQMMGFAIAWTFKVS